MQINSLVSVIISTKNSGKNLNQCLESIKNQTYKNIEIIIVDNNSIDNTKAIARQYTQKVFDYGPERSSQRNYGAKKSSGNYFLFIDSDMELGQNVVKECVEKIYHSNVKGLIISEKSFGQGFWSQCKKLERSFYIGIDWMEAARFFDKESFYNVSGYKENMVAGEDWDLSQRIKKNGGMERINDVIFHNEGKTLLLSTIKKKFYYAQHFHNYASSNQHKDSFKKQTGIIRRYGLFFSQPKKLFKNPLLGIGMLFMKTCEFGFGGIGLLIGKIKNKI